MITINKLKFISNYVFRAFGYSRSLSRNVEVKLNSSLIQVHNKFPCRAITEPTDAIATEAVRLLGVVNVMINLISFEYCFD